MARHLAQAVLALLLMAAPAIGQQTVTLAPTSAVVVVSETQDFTAVVTGTTQKTVRFQVCDGNGRNCVTGGSSTLGTIAEIGRDPDDNPIARYTAPAGFPKPPTCLIVTDGCQVVVKAKLVGVKGVKTTANAIIPVPGVLLRVGLGNDGSQANGFTHLPAISADGRYVTFVSDAANLVPGDTNGKTDLFLRDTCLNAPPECTPSTVRVSVASDGSEANDDSNYSAISADGRYVAFESEATNLAPGVVNLGANIFLRDTCIGAPPDCVPSTLLVSETGTSISLGGSEPSVSANGRYVAFTARGDNEGIFVRDTCTGAPPGCVPSTEMVSLGPDGSPADCFDDFVPCFRETTSISADGRFVAFVSAASNWGWAVYQPQVFVRDTCRGAPGGCVPTTVYAAADTTGGASGGWCSKPRLSPDGRYVAFSSESSNLVAGDTNQQWDVFLRDTCLNGPGGCVPATWRVSVASDGVQGNAGSFWPSVSANGRFIAFASNAANLVGGDTNGEEDVFVRDTCLGAALGCTPTTARVSRQRKGKQANSVNRYAALTLDGRFVVFDSFASNLVADDTNGQTDVFLAATGR